MQKPETIDEYILLFPSEVQTVLTQLREEIRQAAPESEEAISYGIPTFKLHGNLVHFGGFKNHIGLYPGPEAIEHFKKELSKYKQAKGSIQFPLEEQIPIELIRKIVAYRVKQNNS